MLTINKNLSIINNKVGGISMLKFLKKLFTKKNNANEIISLFGNKQDAVVQMGGDYCGDVC